MERDKPETGRKPEMAALQMRMQAGPESRQQLPGQKGKVRKMTLVLLCQTMTAVQERMTARQRRTKPRAAARTGMPRFSRLPERMEAMACIS